MHKKRNENERIVIGMTRFRDATKFASFMLCDSTTGFNYGQNLEDTSYSSFEQNSGSPQNHSIYFLHFQLGEKKLNGSLDRIRCDPRLRADSQFSNNMSWCYCRHLFNHSQAQEVGFVQAIIIFLAF